MCIAIHSDCQQQIGVTIAAVKFDENGNYICKDMLSELEVGIVENNINWFLLTCGTLLMDLVPLQKYLGTLVYINSA